MLNQYWTDFWESTPVAADGVAGHVASKSAVLGMPVAAADPLLLPLPKTAGSAGAGASAKGLGEDRWWARAIYTCRGPWTLNPWGIHMCRGKPHVWHIWEGKEEVQAPWGLGTINDERQITYVVGNSRTWAYVGGNCIYNVRGSCRICRARVR
jgi:hypothetical protein